MAAAYPHIRSRYYTPPASTAQGIPLTSLRVLKLGTTNDSNS